MKASDNVLKSIYEELLEKDEQMIQEIEECDNKVITAFQKYYKGNQDEMEVFRDEIFGILLEEKQKSFCEGAKFFQMIPEKR